MIHLIPTKTTLTSQELAEIYKAEVWRLHGIPRRIISDRGPQFASKFMKELCGALGIKRNLSTAYHPQTDGQTERINQEVEAYLRSFITFKQDDWTHWLPMAEFHYNDKTHSATKNTPFYLNYGLNPWKGELTTKTLNPAANIFAEELKKTREEAAAAMEINNDTMKARNGDKDNGKTFTIGEKVWLEGTNIRSHRPSAKLDSRRYGPFEVTEPVGHTSYRLKIPETWAIHDVFHSSLLTRYNEPSFHGQKRPTPPPPEIINEEEEYEIEEIRGHRKRGRGMQYLVHWKGYGNEDDTWLPKSAMGNAEELFAEYHSKNL
jgi:hypothetical protein